jgi:hypothetical protein
LSSGILNILTQPKDFVLRHSSGRLAEESNQQENNIDNRFRSQDSTRQQPSVINNLDYSVVQNFWAGFELLKILPCLSHIFRVE